MDESTGKVVSTNWNKLDLHTRNQIIGTGKILSIVLPAGSVKIIGQLKNASRVEAGAVANSKLLWTTWREYPKIIVDGREYAQIGGRQYTQHAVERMQPSGAVGIDGAGRNISPNIVEQVISNGRSSTVNVNGVQRVIYTSGNVSVVTENSSRTVVTVLRRSTK